MKLVELFGQFFGLCVKRKDNHCKLCDLPFERIIVERFNEFFSRFQCGHVLILSKNFLKNTIKSISSFIAFFNSVDKLIE